MAAAFSQAESCEAVDHGVQGKLCGLSSLGVVLPVGGSLYCDVIRADAYVDAGVGGWSGRLAGSKATARLKRKGDNTPP